MRIRVTWPDGREKRTTIRTWRDMQRFVGTYGGERRRVSVEAEGDAFHVIVRD